MKPPRKEEFRRRVEYFKALSRFYAERVGETESPPELESRGRNQTGDSSSESSGSVVEAEESSQGSFQRSATDVSEEFSRNHQSLRPEFCEGRFGMIQRNLIFSVLSHFS